MRLNLSTSGHRKLHLLLEFWRPRTVRFERKAEHRSRRSRHDCSQVGQRSRTAEPGLTLSPNLKASSQHRFRLSFCKIWFIRAAVSFECKLLANGNESQLPSILRRLVCGSLKPTTFWLSYSWQDSSLGSVEQLDDGTKVRILLVC